MTHMHARAPALLLCVAALCVPHREAAGQDLLGRVVEVGTEKGVAASVVRLLDEEGSVLGQALSDSAGSYRVSAPGPGEYRLQVEAFGYRQFDSHLLALGARARYRVDIEVTPAPVPISGIEVSADRYAELEDGLRLAIGVHPRSLRYEPILRPAIEDHLARAHGLTELVRWSNSASVVVQESSDGPCFRWRNRHCIPVYLNGAEVPPGTVPVLPLDMLEMIVVMTPGETIAYPGGAVLLYTPGWIN